MTNALHLEFHQAYLRCLTELTPEALGLASAVVDGYRQKIADEQTLVNRTFVSPFTSVIREAHLERSRTFRFIMASIRNARFSTDSAMVEVWRLLKAPILDRYPISILDGDGQKATAQIRGLLLDLRGENRMHVSKLIPDATLAALETANEKFAGNYMSRNTARAEYPVGVMLAVREEVDELYTVISAIVQGHANVTTGDEQQLAIADACATLVGQQNSLLADWRLRMIPLKNRPVVPPSDETPESGDEVVPSDDSPVPAPVVADAELTPAV